MQCTRCKRDAAPGKSRCQHHLNLHLAQMKRQRERRSQDGVCTTCGKLPPVLGYKRCAGCAKLYSESLLRSRRSRVGSKCRECSRPTDEGKYRCAVCTQKRRESTRRLKAEVFNHYGGVVCSCPGCPEQSNNIDFLTIDHIDGGGNAHRRAINRRGGVQIYQWLKKHGFPSGYRVLCYNCNAARHLNGGVCPHCP